MCLVLFTNKAFHGYTLLSLGLQQRDQYGDIGISLMTYTEMLSCLCNQTQVLGTLLGVKVERSA